MRCRSKFASGSSGARDCKFLSTLFGICGWLERGCRCHRILFLARAWRQISGSKGFDVVRNLLLARAWLPISGSKVFDVVRNLLLARAWLQIQCDIQFWLERGIRFQEVRCSMLFEICFWLENGCRINVKFASGQSVAADFRK